MKKVGVLLLSCFVLFAFTGCTESEEKEKPKEKTEYSISETATVNKTNIKINSVKKIMSECMAEYNGECLSETKPKNGLFLLVDLSIENKGTDKLSISSLLSFELKDNSGEKGSYALLTKSITSQLDGSVLAGDKMKGQIAFDVKDSDKYYFYYTDNLLESPIKFVINKSDITE